MIKESISFVVCGNIGPTRGFEQLIKNWKYCPKEACLYIQGKDNDFKTYLQNLKSTQNLIKGKSLFFPAAVRENEIISSIKKYDVGIIPYEPVCLNNKYCFPNKFSQYLKAGLPILANKLPAVARILKGTGAGLSVDFKNEDEFLSVIRYFVEKANLKKAKEAALFLHQKRICWEITSKPFYNSLEITSGPIPTQKNHNFQLSKTSEYYFTKKFFQKSRKIKKSENTFFIGPHYNSRQLLFMLLCLLIAKIIFHFNCRLLKNKPTNYPMKVFFGIRPTLLKIGVFERYDSIVKKRLSPI